MMGSYRHHAIIVTSRFEDHIQKAHQKALAIYADDGAIEQVGPIMPMTTDNGFETFVIGPDGSKEERAESDEGDARRAAMIAWLDLQRYDDGSTPYSWAAVQYGDEHGDNKMICSDAIPRGWRNETELIS